jgi:NAD(P)H-dependent flavin oxidoreductase YrpB (nitropropane dioxygenase family)
MSGLRVRESRKTGDVDSAPLMIGQSIGLINDIPICRELLDIMAKEALEKLDQAPKMIQ